MEWNARDYISLAVFIITAGGGLIAVGGLIYSLKNVIGEVNDLREQIDTTKEALSKHTADKDAHVNHLYMASLKESIKELKDGNKEINTKLDRIAEKLYERK